MADVKEAADKQAGPLMPQRQAKMKMKATEGHPYIKTGKVFEVHPVHEADLRAKGWACGEKEDHTKIKGEIAVPAKAGEVETLSDVKENGGAK